MPSFTVRTSSRDYQAVIERGVLACLGNHLPSKHGKIFVITTEDVWRLHSARLAPALAERPHEVLFFPGGEEHKRLSSVEMLTEEMVLRGGDRSSLVLSFGGGIVTDIGGFAASVFMRGIPVVQIPTTLLAQVDAGVGGKTGVNLRTGKNLVGTFYQPLAVLIDPDVLFTLPEREYRAGLFEVLKCGVIRSRPLFDTLFQRRHEVLEGKPEVVAEIVAECVRIKAEVVSQDEKESDLRRILNFGHTVGHALEAATGYHRFLHGEAVGFGMRAAVRLAWLLGMISAEDSMDILEAIAAYGPLPSLEDVTAESLASRLISDKKTVGGKVHFVLPETIGRVRVVSGIDPQLVLTAIQEALV